MAASLSATDFANILKAVQDESPLSRGNPIWKHSELTVGIPEAALQSEHNALKHIIKTIQPAHMAEGKGELFGQMANRVLNNRVAKDMAKWEEAWRVQNLGAFERIEHEAGRAANLWNKTGGRATRYVNNKVAGAGRTVLLTVGALGVGALALNFFTKGKPKTAASAEYEANQELRDEATQNMQAFAAPAPMADPMAQNVVATAAPQYNPLLPAGVEPVEGANVAQVRGNGASKTVPPRVAMNFEDAGDAVNRLKTANGGLSASPTPA